ncbi:unnamed protein product [Adineta steineri]|uniref:Uncharacterized protein n=1 Tax=Adineta steineri TaxID=433720 RepID=A0A814NCJ8_9BILA|nr:unnamed protein product [Adineta steineri]CAF3852737.1 unnamed protein product [Adineta steineri]CAF4082173.1 unnamed protein product [Adineta steineri]
MNRNRNQLKRIHSKNNDIESPAKRQFRNETEKRRRDLFTQLITNLKDILLVKKPTDTNEENTKLDKASILCQAATFLEQHKDDLTHEIKLVTPTLQSPSSSSLPNPILDFCWKPSCDIISIDEWLQIAIESMHCFFLVIKFDINFDKIVYVSKNINSYFGYSQDELINHSLFEFILPSNHDRLLVYLLNNHEVLQTCDISWKRSIDNDYEQCTLIGAYRTINANEKYFMSIVKINTLDRMLMMNIDHPINEFVTYLNIQGKFVFIDSKARQILGYSSFEIVGRTYFDFVHPDDLNVIVRAYKLWKETGSGKSEPYRFLTKGEQWILLQTSSQVHINTWTGKVESYICTTYIVQCQSLQKQLSERPITTQIDNSNTDMLLSPPMITTTTVQPPSIGTTISSILNNQDGSTSSSENEITSFLSHLRNDTYRTTIFEKLIECRKIKQNEINIRQEEIQVIDDILQFVTQYHTKHSNNQLTSDEMKNPNVEDVALNIFDTNSDLTLFNSPMTNTVDPYCIQVDPIDPLSCLFSSSPAKPFSNLSTTNDPIQDLEYLTSTTNPTEDGTFS